MKLSLENRYQTKKAHLNQISDRKFLFLNNYPTFFQLHFSADIKNLKKRGYLPVLKK